MQYRHYNTGDQIWVRCVSGRDVVTKMVTNYGLTWEEGQSTNIKLTGAKRFIHRLVVAWIRFFHVVMA